MSELLHLAKVALQSSLVVSTVLLGSGLGRPACSHGGNSSMLLSWVGRKMSRTKRGLRKGLS